MKIKIDLDNYKKRETDLIVKFLLGGKVVAYPTDTIYGLGCSAENTKAIKKVIKIKKIKKQKALIVLIDGFKMLKKYCQISKAQENYARKVWQGNKPTTIIFKSKNNLPKEILGESGTLAVRLPKSKFLIKIIGKINAPLVSTSLNIAGKESLNSLDGIDNYFKTDKPDLVIDAGRIKRKKASRIIDLINLKPDGSGVKKIR